MIKRAFLLFTAALLTSFVLIEPATAANGADWNAGNIIDDTVFNNKNAMGVDEIQNFLNAKVPVCDYWGAQSYSGTTRRAYSEARGEVFPLKCVKEYYENPTTHENNLQGRSIPAGGISAAQIIYAAAQGYNINPQVLIVLLQKEQGLITDDWPWVVQYRSATGYGCPDTAACDANYYGFYNQVATAAWQFRHYANNPYSFNHVAGQVNNIRLSPNAACGTSSVYIQNQTTASLYNYTPYTPNQAALNNLYGTGDGCSAYGNRNFWRYFIDWFGSPYTNFAWRTIIQYAYFDANKQMQVNLGALGPNQRYLLYMVVQNTGNVTWYGQNSGSPNPINLGTSTPNDRISPFCDASWVTAAPGCNRTATLREQTVRPGQYGSFEFWITTPSTPGVYNERYTPVQEGITWLGNASISYPMVVLPGYNSGQTMGYGMYADYTKQQPIDPRHLIPGHRYYAVMYVKNTGILKWNRTGANAMHLGTISPTDRSSPFCEGTWLACSRPAAMQDDILPGQTAAFEFWITAPSVGNYIESFMPVIEGVGWLPNPVTFNIKIEPYNWEQMGVYAFTDSSKQTQISLNNLQPGNRYYVSMHINNTGWLPWYGYGDNAITLGTSEPRDRSSAFCDVTWADCARPAALHENSVGSTKTGSFEFWITAPNAPGTYSEAFTPIMKNIGWMGTQGMSLTVNVGQVQHYGWDILVQYVFADNTKTTQVNPTALLPNHRYYLAMVVRNTSSYTWKNNGTNPMNVGTTFPTDRSSPMCENTWINCNRPAHLLEGSVAPGGVGTFEFWITTPATPGTYNEFYAPVHEGIGWLKDHSAGFPLTVRSE